MQTATVQMPTQPVERPAILESIKEKVKKIFPSAKFRFFNAVTYRKYVKYGAVYVNGKPLSDFTTEEVAWNKAYQKITKTVQI